MAHFGKNLISVKMNLDTDVVNRLKTISMSQERSLSSLVRLLLARGIEELEREVQRAA